ncbi:hypothetical protein [Peribacillus simplex]|uniref:hypothetical protein n=1 Tax=Peribacillus simplex TaxID=1478 RepID=UPI0025A28A2C|nr:hypothetical protein [Peribacillus simplex]
MTKKFIGLFLVVLALFVGVSSVSASTSSISLVESRNFEGAQQTSAVEPKVLPAIAAIGAAARVAQAGVKVATSAAKVVGAGFGAAAGADAYTKISKGKSLSTNVSGQDAELAFD